MAETRKQLALPHASPSPPPESASGAAGDLGGTPVDLGGARMAQTGSWIPEEPRGPVFAWRRDPEAGCSHGPRKPGESQMLLPGEPRKESSASGPGPSPRPVSRPQAVGEPGRSLRCRVRMRKKVYMPSRHMEERK